MITLDRAKRYLGDSVATTAQYDAQLIDWIEGITEAIEAYLNRPVLARAITKASSEITIYDRTTIDLGDVVSSLIAVEYQEQPHFGAWALLPPSEYVADGRFVRFAQPLTVSYRYKVTYSTGYAYDILTLSTAPKVLQNIAEEMLLERWNESRSGQARHGLLSKAEAQMGATATTTFRDMLSRYHAQLEPFRRSTV